MMNEGRDRMTNERRKRMTDGCRHAERSEASE